MSRRIVIDTTCLVSAAIKPNGKTADAFRMARQNYEILVSNETLNEALEVLNREKFDRFDPQRERLNFLKEYMNISVSHKPTVEITDCIDPKDNMFLSLAVSAEADCILSGDESHLQPMSPFRGIEILGPKKFLEREHKIESVPDPVKQLSAKDMADELMGGPGRGPARKQPKIDTSPSIGPDFSRGMELRRNKPSGEDDG